MITGNRLNEILNLGAKHALYRNDGTWYHNLIQFPGVLFDRNGYVIFETENDYLDTVSLKKGKELHIQNGISTLKDYKNYTYYQQRKIQSLFEDINQNSINIVQPASRISKISVTNLLHQITSLRRAPTKFGLAPHKPILLLAVINGFEKGYLKGKEVPISEELLASFHDYWRLLVDTGHDANFSLPFFHLGSEKSGIWKLQAFYGKEIPVTKSNSIKSFKALKQTVAYAVLSDELVLALQNPVQRNEIKQTLIQHYFPAKTGIIQANTVLYSESVKKDILYDPTENYVRKVIRYFEEIKTEEREEELILRSHIFKKAVIEVYDGCCAISGQKLKIDANPVLLDACHIIPFAESHDDTITNGLALSPTLHRAFDRGLVTISDNYRIQIHPRLTDYYPEAGISQFNNQELKLPADSRFYPSPEKLYRHRQRFAFQV